MNLSPQNGYRTFIRNCDSVHSNGLKNTKENDKKIIFYFPLILSCGFLSSSCVKFIKKKVQIKPNIALTKQVLFKHNEGLLTFILLLLPLLQIAGSNPCVSAPNVPHVFASQPCSSCGEPQLGHCRETESLHLTPLKSLSESS